MPRLEREALDQAMAEDERERREESATRRLLKQAQDRAAGLEEQVDLLTLIDGVRVVTPEWAQPPKTRSEHRAVANLMLSDLHLDEVVDPALMSWKNAYNREIALQRVRRVGENTITMARDFISGVQYDGLYLWWNGDTISGNIHEELRRTNAGHGVADTIDHWSDHLAGLLSQLADYFKRVHVVTSYGNHGRSTDKPPSKQAVRSSFDWLMVRNVWRELRSDERLTWNISESMEAREKVYNTAYLMQHGDAFKGGDQIAGAVRPVMMGDYRTLVAEIVDGQPYDVLLVGHFHQYKTLGRAIINGSVIGHNEWAKAKRFRPEPAQQAFWLTTEAHGPSFHLPIIAVDRRGEGW